MAKNTDWTEKAGNEVKGGIVDGFKKAGFDLTIAALTNSIMQLGKQTGSLQRTLVRTGINQTFSFNQLRATHKTQGLIMSDLQQVIGGFVGAGVWKHLDRSMFQHGVIMHSSGKGIDKLIKVVAQSSQIFGRSQGRIEELTDASLHLADNYQRDSADLLGAITKNTEATVKQSTMLSTQFGFNMQKGIMETTARFGTELEGSIQALVSEYLTPGFASLVKLQQVGLTPADVAGGGSEAIMKVLEGINERMSPFQGADAWGLNFEAMQGALGISSEILPLLLASQNEVGRAQAQELATLQDKFAKSTKTFDRSLTRLQEKFALTLTPIAVVVTEMLPTLMKMTGYFFGLVIAKITVGLLRSASNFLLQKGQMLKNFFVAQKAQTAAQKWYLKSGGHQRKLLMALHRIKVVNEQQLRQIMLKAAGGVSPGAGLAMAGVVGKTMLRFLPWVGAAWMLIDVASQFKKASDTQEKQLKESNDMRLSLNAIKSDMARTADALAPANNDVFNTQLQANVLAGEMIRLLSRQIAVSEGLSDDINNLPALQQEALNNLQSAAIGNTNTLTQ